MDKIDLETPDPGRRITALSYGPSRSGKTRFAGTWPRPLFLSDASESGWETLRHMAPEDLYEPDVKPHVWALHSSRDMFEALAQAEHEVIRQKKYATVVIDSLTFYADGYMAMLEGLDDKKVDKRQLYGNLASHLRGIMLRVHQMPVNVVWLALDKAPNETVKLGGVRIAGQSSDTAPARCDYWFYHRCLGPENYELRTRQFGAYPAGGRDGGNLPNPLEPSYRAIEAALGLERGIGNCGTAPVVAAPAPAAIAAPKPVTKPANGGGTVLRRS